VRDYVDVVALTDALGRERATATLADIDTYYSDPSDGDDSVQTVLVQRLSEPTPRDRRVTSQLSTYKGLSERWQDWSVVSAACRTLADALLRRVEDESP
jgi:hypothetical protein